MLGIPCLERPATIEGTRRCWISLPVPRWVESNPRLAVRSLLDLAWGNSRVSGMTDKDLRGRLTCRVQRIDFPNQAAERAVHRFVYIQGARIVQAAYAEDEHGINCVYHSIPVSVDID